MRRPEQEHHHDEFADQRASSVPAQLDYHTLSIPEALAAEEVVEQRGRITAQAEERPRTFGPKRR